MAKLWVYGMGEEKKIYRDNQKIMRIPQKPGQLARKKDQYPVIESIWPDTPGFHPKWTTNPAQKRWPEGQDAEVVATWSFSSISRRFKSSKASDLSGKSGATTSFGIFFNIFRGPRVSVTSTANGSRLESSFGELVLASLLVDFVNDFMLNMIKLKLFVAHSAHSCVKMASYR